MEVHTHKIVKEVGSGVAGGFLCRFLPARRFLFERKVKMTPHAALNPPAIVRQVDQSEQELVNGILKAVMRDNFAVGRYAVQWRQQHARGRSDAAIAAKVNDANPDAQVSEEYIRTCRRVVLR